MDPVAELLWELFDESTEGMDESTRAMLCKTTGWNNRDMDGADMVRSLFNRHLRLVQGIYGQLFPEGD